MHKTGLIRISVPKIWPNWGPAFLTFSLDAGLSAFIILINVKLRLVFIEVQNWQTTIRIFMRFIILCMSRLKTIYKIRMMLICHHWTPGIFHIRGFNIICSNCYIFWWQICARMVFPTGLLSFSNFLEFFECLFC